CHHVLKFRASCRRRKRRLLHGTCPSAPRHNHRNAGFIRQQHAPVAHLPDESGVPRERDIVHWWQCPGCVAQIILETAGCGCLLAIYRSLSRSTFDKPKNLWNFVRSFGNLAATGGTPALRSIWATLFSGHDVRILEGKQKGFERQGLIVIQKFFADSKEI